MKPYRTSLQAASMDCRYCGTATYFEETLVEYLARRRKKTRMRVIELDSEGYSRKWSGTFIANNTPGPTGQKEIIRDDGAGHPHIVCKKCGKVNVFGLEFKSDNPEDGIIQVLGRSEPDLRLLKEQEDGDQGNRDHRLVREKHPPEESLAGGSRSESDEGQASGHGDRDEGT